MSRIRIAGRSFVCTVGFALLGGMALMRPAGAPAATVSFQDGVNGYAGTSDTWIGSALPDNDNSGSAVVEWDGEDGGGQNYGLLRFNDIFGDGAGQIPAGALVSSATLQYEVTNPGNNSTVNEVLVDWAPPNPVTWNTFGGDAGVQVDEYGTQVGSAVGAAGVQSLNVTSSMAAWSANPLLNRGWIFRPTGGTDGVEFVSSNSGTVTSRPKLTVTYTVSTAVDLSPGSINTVVGKADVPVTVSIPPGSNSSNEVVVTLTTDNAAVAVPVGASGGSLGLTFAVGASVQQTVSVDIGQAGSATITTTNDAGLDDDTVAVSVSAGTVGILPAAVDSGTGTSMPLKVSISAGSNDTRAVNVSLTTSDTAVVEPVGASGGTRTVLFAAGAANSQFIDLQCGQAGNATIDTGNDGELGNVSLPVHVFEGFNFTATADPRSQVTRWTAVLAAIQEKVTTVGVFHVSPGDIDPPQPLRDAIDSRFGPSVVWYPNVGNHEVETASDMTWIRSEYQNGNGVRTALKYFTNQDGPAGSVETTFSWDYGNAHFICLNQYWNGGTAPGSDVATDGDIVPALYNWLAADLAANTRPVVFVFGHEPAFPFNRHVGDSLDKYAAHRDAFWALLQSYGVHAFLCGHTHYYSKYQTTPDGTWQIDLGNAGNDPGDGQTFANVIVTDHSVTYDIWRNRTGSWVKQESWTVPVGPRLIVEPDSISREVRIGSDLTSDTFTVSAIGPVPVNYSISVDGSPAWLSVSPTGGVFSGTPNSHDIIYTVGDLPVGQYAATIRVTSPEAVNGPQTVTVNVAVRTAVADFDGDNDVDQSDYGHLQACLTGESIAVTDPACLDASLDGDEDVDGGDITVFLTCYGGPDLPIPPECP